MPGIGRDLLDVPFAELVRNLAVGIADGQTALDKNSLETLKTLVDFVGGITLDEDSDAALALKKHFARNVVDQLAAKARTPAIAGERR